MEQVMPSWVANNIFRRRDYFVGIPWLLCALTLPFLERPNAVSEWTVWLVACYVVLLSLTAFYRPTALFLLPLVARAIDLPDGFSSGAVRDGGDLVLRVWHCCWYGLAAAIWLRWFLTRRNEKRQASEAEFEDAGAVFSRNAERDGTPRLSRPLRVLMHGSVWVPLLLFVVIGLNRVRCNAALLDNVRSQVPFLVKFWLARGANPTALTSGQWRQSALELAIDHSDAETVEALCRWGASVNQDMTGHGVPLMQALRVPQEENGLPRLEVVRLLLHYGARADRPDGEGRFPIMLVGEYSPHLTDNDLEIVGLLIGAGANINSRDGDGNTYLVQRLKFGDIDTSAYMALMALGANPTLENKRGDTFEGMLESNFHDNVTRSHTSNGRRKRRDERNEISHLMQAAANPLLPSY